MKKIILGFFICILLPFVISLEVSPSQINFHGKTGETICKKFTISGSNLNIIANDRWTLDENIGRDFLAHKSSARDLGLRIDYEKEFFIEESIEKKICLSGEKTGDYHGVLLFRADGHNSGVGTWISVELSGEDLITLGDNGIKEGFTDEFFILSLILTLLTILLLIIFKFV